VYSLGCFQHSLVKSLVKNFMKWCYTFTTLNRRVVLIEPVLIDGLDILHCVINFVMNDVDVCAYSALFPYNSKHQYQSQKVVRSVH
jgi:hypothetical protein